MGEHIAAEVIVAKLTEIGVTHLFGYPGESTLPLYAATQGLDYPRHVMARCERCAGYMADGFARFSGRVGVCDSPGGVGTPWLVPALHEAWASAIPMVAITTSAPAVQEGRWPTTHCDHQRLFDSVSKKVLSLSVPMRTAELVDRAFTLAAQGRPGPVVLDVEPELLGSPAPRVDGRTARASAANPSCRTRPDRAQLDEVAMMLIHAERPLLIVGGGIHLSRGYDTLARLVQRRGLAVATTMQGKGALDERSPNWCGVVGAKGHPEANEKAEKADLVLWVGSKGGDKSTQYGALPAAGSTAVQVDIDPEALGLSFPLEVGLCADAGAFFDDLDGAIERADPQWRAPSWIVGPRVADATGDSWSSPAVVGGLGKLLSGRFHLVADASKASSWTGVHHQVRCTGRTVIAPRGSGSIGYALPAAIGAAFARPDLPAIAVTGDGGFSMSCHELEVACEAGLDLLVVVLDNRALGLLEMVGSHKHRPDFTLPGRPSAQWDLVSRGYGAEAVIVGSWAEFASAIGKWEAQGGVLVIDAMLPDAELSPDFAMFQRRGGSW